MQLLFLIVAFCAEIAGTVAGFGSSTIALPLALLFFDFQTALILVAFLHIFGNIGRISFFRSKLDRRVLLRFGIPSVISTLVGALLVSHIPAEILKALLGIFLVIYAIIFIQKENLRVRSTLTNSLIGGSLSGFLAGLIGTGGALRGAFLTAFGLPKEKYIVTAAAIALAVDITRIPVYFAAGFLSNRYLWYIPLLLPIALAGSFIGKQIIRSLPQKTFKKLVLVTLLVMGSKFVLDWLTKLLV